MSTSTVAVTLQIRDSQREPTHVSLEIEEIPIGTRVLRSAVRLIGLWAAAVACVFIPIAHFVLVPGLFVAGIVFAVLAARASVKVKSTQVVCPKCGKTTEIEKNTTGWPIKLWCHECGTSFSAKRAS